MKEIKLTRGLYTIVDDWWYDYLNQFKWYALVLKHNKKQYYAARSINSNNKSSHLLMHRLIAQAPPNLVVDHKNGIKYDNRDSNLRVCTPSQNTQNSKAIDECKGVRRNKNTGTFYTAITYKGKAYYKGSYDNAIDAAIAYNTAAIELFGEFANLNDIEKLKININNIWVHK